MRGWWATSPRGRYAASRPRFAHPVAGSGLLALAAAAVLGAGIHPQASAVQFAAAAAAADVVRGQPDDALAGRGLGRSALLNALRSPQPDIAPDLGTVLITTVADSRLLASGFVKPLDGVVTSVFGPRLHPILHVWKMHTGLDLSAACGVPVQAVKDGTVSFAGYAGGYGNRVVLDHGGGLSTAYGHLTAYAATAGLAVKQGQIIGYVGSTGLSTGCHLHFEVLIEGAFVDPAPFLDLAPAPSVTIPPALAATSATPTASVTPSAVTSSGTTAPTSPAGTGSTYPSTATPPSTPTTTSTTTGSSTTTSLPPTTTSTTTTTTSTPTTSTPTTNSGDGTTTP